MFRPIATRVAIMAGLGSIALLGGCADIMQQQTIAQIAPDWFSEKALEVKGQGYPDLFDIPQARPVSGNQTQWDQTAASLKQQAGKLEADAISQGAIRTDEDVRATAAQWRACVEEGRAVCGTPENPAPAVPATKPG
ncbi:MAG TPA: hypothetical protein PLN33_17465 [Hyphomonadaceae bacterium]|nr:hypothetical protein [Hyphomonadaceae bacterium]